MFLDGLEPSTQCLVVHFRTYSTLPSELQKQILYAFILTIRTRYIHQDALDLILIRLERMQRGLIPYPYVTFLWTHVGFEPLLFRAKESCSRYTTWPIVLLLLLVGVTPIHHRVPPKACINLLETIAGQSQGLLAPSISTERYFRTFTIVRSIWRLWLTGINYRRIGRLPGK